MEESGKHRFRALAWVGIAAGIVLLGTPAGAPLLGASIAALLASAAPEIAGAARTGASAARDAARVERQRAAEHVRSKVREFETRGAAKTPDRAHWWASKAISRARSLRRAMRGARPGAKSARALAQKPAGPVRRILSAGRTGAAAGWRGARKRAVQARAARRERIRKGGWKCVFRPGSAGLSVAGIRRALRRRRAQARETRLARCEDCGVMHGAPALAWVPVVVEGRTEQWRLCPQCRLLHEDPGLGAVPVGVAPESAGALPSGDTGPQQPETQALDAPQEAMAPAPPAAGALALSGPRELPPLNPGYGKSVAPELAAAAAIASNQPAAIGGGSMPNLPATRGKYAPNVHGGALPTSGTSANHSGWMLLMERIELAVQQARRQYESAAAELAKVNPGRTHYAETLAYLNETADIVGQVRAHIEAVDRLEGPIKSATEALGGPAERADSGYHSVS
jgi:hypothetical protein